MQRSRTVWVPLLALSCLLVGCAKPNKQKQKRHDRQSAEKGDKGGGDKAKGEPSKSGDNEKILASVDAELTRAWAAANIETSPLADDSEFLRRASLDLIGRVPTHDEVSRFLADKHPDKRARVVDALLEDQSFAEHWASMWTERLIPDTKRAQRYAADELEAFLGKALAENRGWDKVVGELLGGEGRLDQHPELAYLGARALRGDDKQDAMAELSSTTARVFLGSRIECAQCHDHPYDPTFSRDDFWAQAAFFGRTVVTLDRDEDKKKKIGIEIAERKKGELRVTMDMTGEDPRKEPITPRYMGAEVSMIDSDHRRVDLAQSIVGDARFAEATVGWVWTKLLGRGIVEPWDDLLGLKDRPPLLELLSAEFRSDGHDLQKLLRTIVLSQAYQRSSAGPGQETQKIAEAEQVFARAQVRPLSAEQLFASVMTVTGLEQVEGPAFRRAVRQRQEAALQEYEFVFADDEMADADGFSASVPQALLLLNGGLTNQGVVAREGGGLEQILSASKDTDERLEDLWLTVYGRMPAEDELKLGRAAVAGGGTPKWEDLMFAMIYSSEFGSNH